MDFITGHLFRTLACEKALLFLFFRFNDVQMSKSWSNPAMELNFVCF